jgi:2-dehydro-3-deoxyphosphogluconate aldolase/(4S)-4-hydroxy-2-oxoglutarate aldolase
MRKYEILSKLEEVGIIAVIRATDGIEAKRIALACMEGGITSIEITFTVPGAHQVIEILTKELGNKLLIGAGTVLDSETARIAMLVGAKYIVSPSFDLSTAKLCNKYQIPYIAGCMTITEMIKALEAGTDIIKVFPGSAFGPSFISAIKGPLPQALLMPTGGVTLNNVEEWIRNGSVAVGVGGSLTKGTSEDITNLARKFVDKIKLARS